MKPAREIGVDDGSAVSLRIDSLGNTPGNAPRTLYCTDIEGTELRVAVGERSSEAGNSVWETGAWYRFDGIQRGDTRTGELRFSPQAGDVERTDAPERRADHESATPDDPWLIRLGASEKLVSVTVQPRATGHPDRLSVGDPETYEIGAVCLEYGDETGDTAVYHRENPETRDEHLLLEHVVDDLTELTGATLLTNGTGRAQLEILQARLRVAAEGDIVDSGASQVLSECYHGDLHRVATRAGDDTLRESARRLGIEVSPVRLSDYDIRPDPAEWRDGWDLDQSVLQAESDPRMTDRDYATLVERYLDPGDESAVSADLGRCLKTYASADIQLIHDLTMHGAPDQLACPRLTESDYCGSVPP